MDRHLNLYLLFEFLNIDLDTVGFKLSNIPILTSLMFWSARYSVSEVQLLFHKRKNRISIDHWNLNLGFFSIIDDRLRIRLILGLRDDLNAAYEVQTALTS